MNAKPDETNPWPSRYRNINKRENAVALPDDFGLRWVKEPHHPEKQWPKSDTAIVESRRRGRARERSASRLLAVTGDEICYTI